jgi:hypothetical protein
MMKKSSQKSVFSAAQGSMAAVAMMLLAATVSWASPQPSRSPARTIAQTVPAFPGTLANARYVYVASYDGDQFNINLLPEDRQAIATVQDAMRQWGKFTLVDEPRQADIVLMVTSRPSEDLLAIYDGRGWPGNEYLWRMMGRGGLQRGEAPLVKNLENAFAQLGK